MGELQKVLLITKGHPFERDAFFSMFDDNAAIEWTHVEQPAAQVFFEPERAKAYDVFVLYDMPGIGFRENGVPEFIEPPAELKSNILDLLATGHGFVFLHHSIAGWPAWPEYGEIVGGRFLYQPASVRGRDCPDSGYRHDVTHTVSVVDRTHPVAAGLPEQFEITDELYLAEIFEDTVVPLLRSGHGFRRENFYSADLAVRGRMYSNEGWHHGSGSNLIGWVKRYAKSPIVYLQPGDGPSAYSNPFFKRLLANAIQWVAGEDAHRWAARE